MKLRSSGQHPDRPMARLSVCVFLSMAFSAFGVSKADEPAKAISPNFQKPNLVAWCIVPFDSQKRTPEQRVAMMKEIGIRRFAYDHRPEHLKTFETELELLKRNGIELTAVWFPLTLNDTAQTILGLLEKHQLKTQLWVMGGGDMSMSPSQEADFVKNEVARLRPIAEAADQIGCKVALYNHGNWFGEPENQLKIIDALQMKNVGIVYNLHHGHDHLDRLPALIEAMKPHLLAFNLNGMKTGGDKIGQKILPIGEGDRDTEVLKQVIASGYDGPIGILNHTDEDARERLLDNLDGLAWCLSKLNGESPTKPQWRSYKGTALFHPALPKQLVAQAEKEGDARHGLKVFSSATAGCISCHAIGEFGGKIGPALSDIAIKRTSDHIATSLLWPNKEVEKAFQSYKILTEDGRVLSGIRSEPDANHISIKDASGKETVIPVDEIEDEQVAGSVMPEALVATMSRSDQLDLLAFLIKLGKADGLSSEVMASVLKHTRGHTIATFQWTKEPLEPELRPWHTKSINRDRLYDYYSKQARHFLKEQTDADLLAEYPGLDGLSFGHWGNQDEAFWAGDESNSMVRPPFISHVYKHDKTIVRRAVCVDLGGRKKSIAMFNLDTLQFEAVWQGDVKYSSVRHGFLDGVRPETEQVTALAPIDHGGSPVYRGFYRFDNQTVFSYSVNGVEYLDSGEMKKEGFVRIRLPADQHPLTDCRSGGPLTDSQRLRTQIETSIRGVFQVDSILLPYDNPWQAPLFCGDFDFASDGSIYLSTMIGDVWKVTGFQDPQSKTASWHRFATGLHQPLGLKVHNDQCYVLGRNQITKLSDLNYDGQADWYECFSMAYDSSPAGHDFICGLQRDEAGNFYTASGNQGLLKISPDGKSVEVLAHGFRNPDGLGITPDGITIPGSEGDWTPASMICWRDRKKEGDLFYGHRGPAVGGRPELPLVYLPRGVDNSSGGQVFVDSPAWKDYQGSLIHLSHGTGTAMHLMMDRVGDQVQGAVSILPCEFRSGAHRGRFSPKDGQLYVAGMNGWGSYAPESGCLERVRYPDKLPLQPIDFHVHQNGIALTLSERVDPNSDLAKSLNDPKNIFVQAWNYRYGPGYGSAEYSTNHYGVRGHDRLKVAKAELLDDGKTLFVELPDLQPANQVHMFGKVSGGRPWEIFATVHALDKPRTDVTGYVAVNKTIAEHPIERDLLMALKKRPNPWAKRNKDARPIVVEAGQNLSFSPREFTVKANEPIALTFKNPDVVPHNWAIVKPNKLQSVGDLANRLINDPEAPFNSYIPATDDVIAYTDIVEGQDETTIYFRAPKMAGRYPFLCTFPGHWMVMNGEMVVED